MTATDLFVWGFVLHLIADFFLQNRWMALNKTKLRHPASFAHSFIHGLLALVVFPWPVALALYVAHALIDTREPLKWWRKVTRQSTQPESLHNDSIAGFISFCMWQDQAAHWLCIALAALATARWF